MRKLIAILLFIPGIVFAKDITTQWDHDLIEVSTFRIYMTTTKGQYTFGTGYISVPAPTLTYQIKNVSDTVKTWAVVVAVGSNGIESKASNELALFAPSAPGNFRVVSVP